MLKCQKTRIWDVRDVIPSIGTEYIGVIPPEGWMGVYDELWEVNECPFRDIDTFKDVILGCLTICEGYYVSTRE